MNSCYPEPERLAIARCLTTNLSTGETMGDDGNNYDYTLFDVVASTLAQDMPEEIEFASCVLTGQGMSIYYEDKYYRTLTIYTLILVSSRLLVSLS